MPLFAAECLSRCRTRGVGANLRPPTMDIPSTCADVIFLCGELDTLGRDVANSAARSLW